MADRTLAFSNRFHRDKPVSFGSPCRQIQRGEGVPLSVREAKLQADFEDHPVWLY